MIKKPKRY